MNFRRTSYSPGVSYLKVALEDGKLYEGDAIWLIVSYPSLFGPSLWLPLRSHSKANGTLPCQFMPPGVPELSLASKVTVAPTGTVTGEPGWPECPSTDMVNVPEGCGQSEPAPGSSSMIWRPPVAVDPPLMVSSPLSMTHSVPLAPAASEA